jgi:ATP-binding cassette subfamily C protein
MFRTGAAAAGKALLHDKTSSQDDAIRDGTASRYDSVLRGLRGPALIAGGLSALINVLMLTGSVYMLQVYDRVLGSGSLSTLQGLFLIVTLAYVFYGLYEFLRARVLSRAAVRLNNGLSAAAFRAWLTAGLGGARGAGQGAGQAGGGRADALPLRDLEILRGFVGSPMMGTLFDLPWVPFYLLVLYVVHPMLGLLTLAGMAVVVVVAVLNGYLTQSSNEAALGREFHARRFADAGQHNAETVVAMGMTDEVVKRWHLLHDASLAVAQKAGDTTEATSAFSKSFRMFLQSAMLTLGAFLVLGHEMSAGMIVAASVISGRALAPIDQLIGQWKQIGRARAAHLRLRAFFATSDAPAEALGLPRPTGKVVATDLVRFVPNAEPGRERRRQIDRVSFALEPGMGLGVIGDSASGKSTLARLLVGVCRADAGELRFDGATREQWGAELARHIGYLPQTVTMLPGTVRDNIRRFQADSPAKDVIDAARMAGVHDMILRLPQGYDTMLGMPDQPLSGGQLQRLGLARAVFGTPPIVVLDEPNSALDEAGEMALREAIRALKAAGSAVVLMTHRRAILDEMDKVLMLRQGAVVKYGARADVLAGLAPAAALPPEAGPEAVRVRLAIAEPPVQEPSVQAPPAAAETPEEAAPARRSVSFLQAPPDNSDKAPPPAVFFHRDSKARSLPQPLPNAPGQRRSAGLARLAAATAAIAEARAKREKTTP